MLVLSRKCNERIFLVDIHTKQILAVVAVTDMQPNKARLGITADKTIEIYREEILPREYISATSESQDRPVGLRDLARVRGIDYPAPSGTRTNLPGNGRLPGN